MIDSLTWTMGSLWPKTLMLYGHRTMGWWWSKGTTVSCAKTAEPINMPFSQQTRVGPWKNFTIAVVPELPWMRSYGAVELRDVASHALPWIVTWIMSWWLLKNYSLTWTMGSLWPKTVTLHRHRTMGWWW